MLEISLNNLVCALIDAPEYTASELNAGMQYILNKICKRLTRSEVVNLSEIDFGAFSLDDIETFHNYFYEIERQNYKSYKVGCFFSELKPKVVPNTFV